MPGLGRPADKRSDEYMTQRAPQLDGRQVVSNQASTTNNQQSAAFGVVVKTAVFSI
jgi:hypothetical protein